MHCLDVAQMSFILLKTGPDCLAVQLELSHVEQLAVIMACVCHDFAHDGFNNGYHVANETARFLAHGSTGVQEKFHFAEAFKLLEQHQIIASMGSMQKLAFKLRMQQSIFSTDMARHMSDLNALKEMTEGLQAGAPIIPTDLPYEEKESRR